MLNTATLSLPRRVDLAPTTRVFELDYYQLKSQLAEAIANSSYRTIQNIEFELRDGAVVLFGNVPSFYLKQLAQTIALGILKARMELKNELIVSERLAAPFT